MSRIVQRPARIIASPEAATTGASRTRRARRVDFASLLQREAEHTPDHPQKHALFHEPDDADAWPQDESLARRIGAASAPVVEAVYRQQQCFIELAAVIASQVANFASNRSLADAGTWEVTLPLDPRVLPDTVLHLRLSPALLSLRFDATDPDARELLLRHSNVLELELKALLAGWGEPRQIEVTVW